MNFRYQAIVFVFLAIAIHFSNGEGVGSISLAQQGPAAAQPTARPNPLDDPNLEFVPFDGKTAKENNYHFRLTQRQKVSNAGDRYFNNGQGATTEIVLQAFDDNGNLLTDTQGNIAKLFGDCQGGCKSELTWDGTLESGRNLKAVIEAAINQGKLRLDEMIEKKKEEERIAAEKRENCEGFDKPGDMAKCLIDKIKTTDNTEKKSFLRERLAELVEFNLEESPQATISMLAANSEIMRNIPTNRATQIRITGGEFLAGKNAYTSASAIENARERCLEAISTPVNTVYDYNIRNTRVSGCNRAIQTAQRANRNAKNGFDRDFRATFGLSGSAGSGIRDAWDNANFKHDRAIAILSNPRNITQQNLLAMDVMGGPDDTRLSGNSNSLLSVLNVNGLDADGDGDIDNLANQQGRRSTTGASRQRQRRNNNLSFGRCQDNGAYRAGVVQCDPFQVYMDRLNQSMSQNTFGNFGSSLSTMNASTINTGSSIVPGTSGRGRPGV